MSVKAEPVAEHNESATQVKKPGAARAPVRLAKLLRGLEGKLDSKSAAAHGDLEILEIA